MKTGNRHYRFTGKILLIVLLPTALVIACLLWWMCAGAGANQAGYEQRKFSPDGSPVLVIAREETGIVNYTVVLLDDLTDYYENRSITFGDVEIIPLKATGGSGNRLFSFGIVDTGEYREIIDFAYSGEDVVTVARGYNWYLQITTM